MLGYSIYSFKYNDMCQIYRPSTFDKRTHNPFVPGSSPGGPTIFPYLSKAYDLERRTMSFRSPLAQAHQLRNLFSY